ncbi:snRNA-activating protein complex subunit [Dirofilaria immitis]
MNELTDGTDMSNLTLNIQDDKRSCTVVANEDINVNDNQPGPSRRQQTNKLSETVDDDLDLVLAEMEESNTLQLNNSDVSTGNGLSITMDELNTLLAINEAFNETLVNLIQRVTLAISKNREAQKLLKAKLRQTTEHGSRVNIKKVPVSRFLFPYFRDSHEMEPPKNEEYELKVFRREYDPLVKEEKKWSIKECQLLSNAVRKSLVEIRIQPLIQRKEMFTEKIRTAGQETSAEQIAEWNSTITELERLISYHKNLPENEILLGDYSEVDWAKIAKVDFLGNRTPRQLRLKWINEQCPRWSKEPWSSHEIQRLKDCAGRWNNWNVIAERLGTNRTAFQCFVKFRSELDVDNIGRSWTKEEDAQLMTLAHCMQVNGKMNWEKISHYMEERSRQQCTIRYRRALDTDIKFGRWDASEDVLLTCSVSRFGTKDWIKVASCVPGRSDSQCRDRWVNVLDKSIKAEPWSVDEVDKLLEGVRIFGKGEWSRISTMLPGRPASHCKSRFRSLLSAKVKLASECRTYPFRRFSWKGKYRRQEVEATFRKLLAADGKGGLAEQVMNSFDMRALSVDEMEALSAMAPEHRIMVMQFLNEVREKRLENDVKDDQSIWKLLSDKLQFNSSYLDSSTQNALLKYYKRFLSGHANELLTHHEKDEFDKKCKVLQETDPEAAKDHVINGLCDLIERSDNSQYCMHQKKLTRSQVLNEVGRYLNSVLIADVNKALSCGTKAFAIPPCTGSLHLYENIQQQIHLLRESAGEFFEPLVSDQNDNIFLQLSRQITLDSEYVLLKAKLRTLLFWPILLYRSIESKDSVERRMYLRSIATAKLENQQKQALESLKVRLHNQLQSGTSALTSDQIMVPENEFDDDCTAELSVGEFLKQRMYKRPRRYITDRKIGEEDIREASVVELDPSEITEVMSRRIDECIESVCTAVQKIYERDFVIPATYGMAAQQSRANTNVTEEAVKDALDAVIDEIASGGISEVVNLLPKTKKGRSKKILDDDDSQRNDTLTEIPESAVTKTSTRKRRAAKDAESSIEQVVKSKRAKKRTDPKLLEKDNRKRGKGKFRRAKK